MKVFLLLFFVGLSLFSKNINAAGRCVTGNENLPVINLTSDEETACVAQGSTTASDGTVTVNQAVVEACRVQKKIPYYTWNDSASAGENSNRCCNGLTPDPVNLKCTGDNSPWDSTVARCGRPQDPPCPSNKKCELQDDDEDLFSSEDEASINARENLDQMIDNIRTALQQTQGEDVVPSVAEDTYECSKNIECESYYCHQGKCASGVAKICRKAKEGEVAEGSVECEDPLVKNSQNICVDVNEIPSIPINLEDFFTGNPNPTEENKCNIGNVTAQESLSIGISSLRAFEWMYQTMNSQNECLQHQETFKVVVDHFLTTKRKELLANFNIGWDMVMRDFHNLAGLSASSDTLNLSGGNNTIQSINFETLAKNYVAFDSNLPVEQNSQSSTFTSQEVAGLNASGVLLYRLLFNRAYLLKNYETDMKNLVDTFKVKLSALDEHYGSLDVNPDSKTWTFGKFLNGDYQSKFYEEKEIFCRYKKKMKVEKRWRRHYRFSRNKSINRNDKILTPDVKNFSRLVDYSENKNQYLHLLENKTLFLIDPMMPGNMGNSTHSFDTYGTGGDKRRGLGTMINYVADNFTTGQIVAGAVGGPSVAALIFLLDKKDAGSDIERMKNFMVRSIPGYLKSSLPPNLSELHSFAEPELGISTKCLNEVVANFSATPIKRASKDCENAEKQILRIGDIGFAQFLIYSMHTKRKFKKGYFSKSDDKTRKGKMAINRFMIDVLEKFSAYYDVMAKAHQAQMDCYEKLTQKGLNMIPEDQGVQIGYSNYGVTPQENGGSSQQAGTGTVRAGGGNKSVNMNSFAFGSRAFLTKFSGLSNSDKVAKDSIFSKANLASTQLAAAAIKKKNQDKRKAFAEKNPDKAKAARELVASLTKSLGSSILNSGSGIGSGGGVGSNSSSGSGSSLGDKSSQTASLSGANAKKDGSLDATSRFGNGVGGGAGSFDSGYSSFKSPTGSGDLSSFSDTGMTGLSKEQERNMLNEIDKAKNELSPMDGDSLFEVVSKGYQRNLNKVLKKKVDTGIDAKKPKTSDKDKKAIQDSLKGL